MLKESVKKEDNSVEKKSDIEKTPVSVTNVWLILTVITLTGLVVISLLGFFNGGPNKEISTWFIFALIGAAVSNISSALISYFTQKTEETKETNMVGQISDIFTDKTREITKVVSVVLKQNNLVSGNREDILRLLMNQSSINGEIKRIRILAHESVTFAKLFKSYSEDKNNRFECMQLDILVHNPTIQDEKDPKISGWVDLYVNKKINNLQIRNPENVDRRSFYGIVIEFTHHNPIGMIGFYRPPYTQGNTLIPFNNSYGVFSQSSILDVLDEYFEYYWGKARKITEKFEEPSN